MYLNKVAIKNFRCFDKTGIEISLEEGLTSFIGKNGSGKTTILEAINFLLGQDYLPSKISEKDFHSDASDLTDEIIIQGYMNNTFFYQVDLRESTYNRIESFIIPCESVLLSIKRRERGDKLLDDPFVINKYVIPKLGKIDQEIYDNVNKARQPTEIKKIKDGYDIEYELKSGDSRNAKAILYQMTYNPNKLINCPKAYYLSKNRENDIAGQYSFVNKILTDLHWKYKKTDDTKLKDINTKYMALTQDLREVIDEKGALINAINSGVIKIASENKDFQLDFIDIEQPYKSAFLSKTENDKLLLPESLGSGFAILLAYSLYLYIAELEKLPIIMLIDEPELHLHVDWQSKLFSEFSQQKKLQVICSTQSENFVSLNKWRSIKRLKGYIAHPKEFVLKEKIKSTADNNEYELREYLDDYAQIRADISIILKENLEMLFTKKCILVEGPSEKYALPKLLQLKSLDLKDHSIAIIPAWGKQKIKIYQMICKAFGIEYFTVYDCDKKDTDEPTDENSAIINNAQDDNAIGFSNNFEKQLDVPTTGNKFQNLLKRIDELDDFNQLSEEIQEAVEKINIFIKS